MTPRWRVSYYRRLCIVHKIQRLSREYTDNHHREFVTTMVRVNRATIADIPVLYLRKPIRKFRFFGRTGSICNNSLKHTINNKEDAVHGSIKHDNILWSRLIEYGIQNKSQLRETLPLTVSPDTRMRRHRLNVSRAREYHLPESSSIVLKDLWKTVESELFQYGSVYCACTTQIVLHDGSRYTGNVSVSQAIL